MTEYREVVDNLIEQNAHKYMHGGIVSNLTFTVTYKMKDGGIDMWEKTVHNPIYDGLGGCAAERYVNIVVVE